MKSLGSSFFLFQLYSCPPLAFLVVPVVPADLEAAGSIGLAEAVFTVAGGAVASTFGFFVCVSFESEILAARY
jgi:hypothetical protein